MIFFSPMTVLLSLLYLLRTTICDLLGIKYPIIQGGMAHVATSELVTAISNAGGLGIIGTGHYQPDWVCEQIRLTMQLTSQPFGVNLAFTSPCIGQVVEVILSEEANNTATIVTRQTLGYPPAYITK